MEARGDGHTKTFVCKGLVSSEPPKGNWCLLDRALDLAVPVTVLRDDAAQLLGWCSTDGLLLLGDVDGQSILL